MWQVREYVEQKAGQGDDGACSFEYERAIWLCVADGVGGTGVGYLASQFILDYFGAYVQKKTLNTTEDFELMLRNIDSELAALKFGAESTAVVAKIENDVIIGASVGDSQAWVFTPSYEYELTSLQYVKPLLGSGDCIPIGFGPTILKQALVVGSDGVFKYVDIEAIKSLLGGDRLVSDISLMAKRATGSLQDDIAIIVVTKKS